MNRRCTNHIFQNFFLNGFCPWCELACCVWARICGFIGTLQHFKIIWKRNVQRRVTQISRASIGKWRLTGTRDPHVSTRYDLVRKAECTLGSNMKEDVTTCCYVNKEKREQKVFIQCVTPCHPLVSQRARPIVRWFQYFILYGGVWRGHDRIKSHGARNINNTSSWCFFVRNNFTFLHKKERLKVIIVLFCFVALYNKQTQYQRQY